MCNRSDLAIKRILLVHQFEDKHHQDLYLLKRFLLNFNAELHLLQISRTGMDKEKIEKNMHDFAKEHGLENIQTHVIKDTDVENGVIHFNQMIDMDLVCIGTHGKGGFFHSSATEKLINHLYKPIISFHLN
jgi:nucleotide-binding universal stress UspA family protein